MAKFISVIFCTILLLGTTIVVAEDDEEDKNTIVTVTGTFELMTPPNASDYREYLTALDYSEEEKEGVLMMKPVFVTISNEEGGRWNVEIKTRLTRTTMSFVSGVEFEELLYDTRKVTSIATVGENYIIKVQKFKDFDARQVLIFNKDGFKVTFDAKGISGVQEYRRVTPEMWEIE